MRYWFRGKRGGLVIFLMITGLVVGGLGWMTRTALRLEQEQIEARREAEFSTNLRLALYRLDSRVFTDFAQEANRPYHHYAAADLLPPLRSEGQQAAPPVTGLELLLVSEFDQPPWMQRHFLVALEPGWRSPQMLRSELVQHLGIAGRQPNSAPPTVAQRQLPTELSSDAALRKLLAEVRPQEQQLGAMPAAQPGENAVSAPVGNEAGNSAQQPLPTQSKGYDSSTPQKFDKDTALRFGQAQGVGKGQQATRNYNSPYFNNLIDNTKGKGDKQVLAIVGPLVPLWLTAGHQESLVVTRLVQIGQKSACHVTILDWLKLQELLAEEIRDLFPEARFRPVRDEVSERPELAMATLPVELEPGPVPALESESAGTSLRLGLALAWLAALVALSAVGLGGWSLLDLAERRIRFVSAVTHELRTPLTTLRLYLDMLAGGMIKEEKQKTEYLHTLNAEADRLNRLVGNVLDFSRLENQRPGLEKTEVALGDILEQVRSTWQGRCLDAGKELVVENSMDGARLFTDVQLVQQILGNLIDNACKYSRGAEDHHIWLRARSEGLNRLVLEVEDRGPGVLPRERRSIFRPFHRGTDVTAGGVGLGLALAQRWARLLDGRLGLHNGPGRTGACFRFELPLSSA